MKTKIVSQNTKTIEATFYTYVNPVSKRQFIFEISQKRALPNDIKHLFIIGGPAIGDNMVLSTTTQWLAKQSLPFSITIFSPENVTDFHPKLKLNKFKLSSRKMSEYFTIIQEYLFNKKSSAIIWQIHAPSSLVADLPQHYHIMNQYGKGSGADCIIHSQEIENGGNIETFAGLNAGFFLLAPILGFDFSYMPKNLEIVNQIEIPSSWITNEIKKDVHNQLEAIGVNFSKPLWFINLLSSNISRIFSTENIVKLFEQMTNLYPDVQLLLNYGCALPITGDLVNQTEQEYMDLLLTSLNFKNVFLMPFLNLKQLSSLLSDCTLSFTPDTGINHLCSAKQFQQLQVLSIYQNLRKIRQWGYASPRHKAVIFNKNISVEEFLTDCFNKIQILTERNPLI